jgi:hypothetical protein
MTFRRWIIGSEDHLTFSFFYDGHGRAIAPAPLSRLADLLAAAVVFIGRIPHATARGTDERREGDLQFH